jgi:uncharacterized coiled-coil DUF342 family protein
MDTKPEDLSSSLKEIDEKMTTFSSILEKFGLDIITKMGQTNLKITQLTDLVEDLNKSTIEIKGLKPQLSNVIQNQKLLEDEISLIKSLIINITATPSKKKELENTIVRDESVTSKKDLIINQLNDLRTKLETDDDDPQTVKTILEQIKEEIYEFTGGHRMLYEISQILTRLDSARSLEDLMDGQDLSSKSIRNQLIENITFWINKLMIKD